MTTIVVMAKEPVPGRVKTRLCPPCSGDEAAALAAASLRDTLSTIGQARCDRRVLAFDGDPDAWLPAGWSYLPQGAGDLGHRLDAAVGAVRGPVLVVGMDTPQLTPGLLDDASGQLSAPGVDAVLGPARDGGYWAIGLRDRRDGVFAGVAMSTPDTHRQQRVRLTALGLRVRALPTLRDVDTIADARSVAAAAPDTEFARTLHTTAAAR